MMKNISRWTMAVAASSLALLVPSFVYSQDNSNKQSSQDPSGSFTQAQRQEAAEMVPAQAYLLNKLEAKDAKPGTQFTARLSETIRLKNGPELPKGTDLIGTVSTDDMQLKGTSKLALRITEARLKDGKTVPVKATIVGVYGPNAGTPEAYNVPRGDQEANDWTNNILAVDQLDAMSGVELHSRIDGNNSGVFVAKKKDNVKISSGTELALAIAEQGNAQTGGSGAS
jgi:predicted RecA/RadA family phage recombinase